MELHGLDWELAMAKAHNHAILGFRRDFKTGRESLLASEQGVIAADLEALRQPLEHSFVVVEHLGGLPMHWIIQHAQLPAACLHDSLKAQTNAEHRNACMRLEILTHR